MTVVVGTAGHIDHGKTSLLRALTGIDADRLPEERRRGMTIDVGYAHLALPDGDALDFVDVPGHDRLVGNMLVGAGEVDAAMLVVAADDGPKAQTLEHLELLDALEIEDGIAVITKVDLVAADDPRRVEVADAVSRLLERTTLAGSPVLLASASTGEGLDALRAALVDLRDRVEPRIGQRSGAARLAVDRAFTVKGRGVVVTGTLRGGRLMRGATLRVEPGGRTVRARELQVHGGTVGSVEAGGRVALNLAGAEAGDVRRGDVLVGAGPSGVSIVASDRLLVELRAPAGMGGRGAPGGGRGTSGVGRAAAGARSDAFREGTLLRLHIGTAQVDAAIRRSRHDVLASDGSLVTRLRLAAPIAAAAGDRFALRRPSPAATAAGGRVLDPLPPAGASRRRATADAVEALRDASRAGDAHGVTAATVGLHGALPLVRVAAPLGNAAEVGRATTARPDDGQVAGPLLLAADLAAALRDEAIAAVAAHHARRADAPGLPLEELRHDLARMLRRRATASPTDAAAATSALVDRLVAEGLLARDGDVLRDPARDAGPPPALAAAMHRLEAALATAAPPPFDDAVRASGCPPEGVRALEQSGRIVRLGPDLAFAALTYRELSTLALRMATAGPLTPAAFRDATGTSRKFALVIIEDLDRRQLLRRTPDGHVLGPRAPRSEAPAG